MCWRDTLAVLRALARAGFMVNLRKCKFLTPNAAVLGLDLCKWGYTLGLKFLGNLQNARIPTNLKELQKLVGQLLYASPHLANFKAHIRPIEALLSGKGRVLWTEQCTQALNSLLRGVYARVRLVPADPAGALVMYPSVQGGVGFVACCQDQG